MCGFCFDRASLLTNYFTVSAAIFTAFSKSAASRKNQDKKGGEGGEGLPLPPLLLVSTRQNLYRKIGAKPLRNFCENAILKGAVCVVSQVSNSGFECIVG